MKLLAIDFGMKRVGFAVGNLILRTAVPIPPIIRQNSKQLLNEIAKLILEYDITAIIIGHPLNMDGTKSEFTLQVEHFTNRLKKRFPMDVTLVDERLSSFEAEEVLKSHLHSPKNFKKYKKSVDSISASVILNDYMENHYRISQLSSQSHLSDLSQLSQLPQPETPISSDTPSEIDL